MSWAAVGVAVVGTVASASAAGKAEKAGESAQARAEQLTWAQLGQQEAQFRDLLKLGEPYRAAGQQGLEKYIRYTQEPGTMYEDPAYQAMLAQGTKAVEGSAAAKGTQLSGKTLAGLQELGQSTASQYRSQIMGELANLANIGSTAVGQAYGVGGQAMSQTAGAYGNLATLAQQTGQIQAGAAMGQGTALANLAGTLGAAYIKNQGSTG